MVETFEVGTTARATLKAEYDRLSAAGIDMAWAYRVDYWPGGWVKVHRYAISYGGATGDGPYLDPETCDLALAEPTWHRVTS